LTVLEILLLQENGTLHLTDSIRKHLPDLNISHEITLEMLASQLSGLGRDRAINPVPKNLDLSKYVLGSCGRPWFTCTAEEFNEIIEKHPPVFQPDTHPACTSSVVAY
jgi:CubicO group peptidase (beta-lactamase class C family)